LEFVPMMAMKTQYKITAFTVTTRRNENDLESLS
jgi:hypothetical protein